MDKLHERLARLDPPLRHEVVPQDDGLLITLIDPQRNTRVSRLFKYAEMQNVAQLNLMLLYAINELRHKGAQVPLDKDLMLIANLPQECADLDRAQ